MVNDMMTAEQLKGSILQLAMQGKLVEQRPEEGTGEELYKEILDYQGTAAKDYDASNVFVLNTDNKDRLREQSKKLIIIDIIILLEVINFIHGEVVTTIKQKMKWTNLLMISMDLMEHQAII